MKCAKIILISKVLYANTLVKHSKEYIKDFTFVIDNYFSKESKEIEEIIKPYVKDIVYSKDVIDFTKKEIKFSKLANDILDIYPPTIKIMLPMYFNNLGYEKMLYLDDDIILNDNLDNWTAYNNAVYRETMSGVRAEWDSVSFVFGDDLDKQAFNKNCLINSGHFVLDLSSLNIEEYKYYFLKFLNNDKTFPQLLHSKLSNHHGQFWIYEQRFFGFIMYKLVKCKGNDINLLNRYVKLIANKSTSTASFKNADVVHFAVSPKPKKLLYENLDRMLSNKIKNISEILKSQTDVCKDKKLSLFMK